MICEIPIKIISESNGREHFRVKAQRVALHRRTARIAVAQAFGTPPLPPLIITLTRIGPRMLDDDNLAGGFKAARDGISDWLRVDDGSPLLKWRYEQRKGRPKEYAAEVCIKCLT